MILLLSGIKVPWTLVRGQSLAESATRILMNAAVRHAAAPTQNKKTLRARASSMDQGPWVSEFGNCTTKVLFVEHGGARYLEAIFIGWGSGILGPYVK